MSLLGEISKSSEALRYHAKTAEIAGQNLAHVNDETYARQRVLAREGVMYGSHGGLLTSGLESGGLEHVRNDFLDRRVVDEVGQTAALEAEKEVFDLLQAALGETLTSPQINAGLDDTHDSILAPGSLARALNDFFNAFQELSASPDEATIRQELYNKTQTLTKRFNDAGQSLEDIEYDLTQTVARSIDDVNRILSQLHEVNKQVRRFELQDKGKAVTYRDRRQALLEDLSKLMEVKVEDAADLNTGEATGFLNVFATSKDGQQIKLLDSTGPKKLTNKWNQDFSLSSNGANGTDAKIHAKIDSNGQLGFLEVQNSGTLFDDTDGPILVSLLPPKPISDDIAANAQVAPQAADAPGAVDVLPAGQPVDDGAGLSELLNEVANAVVAPAENLKRNKGDVFYFQKPDGETALWQALDNTIAGTDPNSSNLFMEITQFPNGQVNEVKKSFSDLESFDAGDQIYYEGKLYQATSTVSPVSEETGNQSSVRNYLKNDIFKFGDSYFQASTNIARNAELDVNLQGREKGDLVSLNVFGETGVAGSVVALGNTLPNLNDPEIKDPLLDATVVKGDYLRVDNGSGVGEISYDYYIALDDVDLVANPTAPSASEQFLKVSAFSETTKKVDDFLAFNNTTQAQELDFSNTEGDVLLFDGNHYLIKSAPDLPISDPLEIANFNPSDNQWKSNFKLFKAQVSADNPEEVVRLNSPSGYDVNTGVLVEVNLGLAEAVVSGGEIKGFNIINKGNGFPSNDAILIEGNEAGQALEIVTESGVLAGYQNARVNGIELYRTELNGLVSSFVEKVNGLHNPTDEPGGYLFGFDSFLSRPVMGNNKIMEEEYGLYGVEGNGTFKVFDEEVNMTLPFAETDTFEIVNSTPIFPAELQTNPDAFFVRGDDYTENLLDSPDGGQFYEFFGSARRMQHISFEGDPNYIGEDGLIGTGDEGRSLMLAYEEIPFRVEQGSQAFLLGDNFTFDAVLANPWNLAASLKVDSDLTPDLLKSSEATPEGASDIAYEIGALADGEFNLKISTLNADIGNKMSDLSDNYDHQKSLENLLLDQRRSVSSVSIDEEVADLMQFQRSFQASSRVLNTLDKMLELVVMGLLK
jgi:flagellar hook-associated protein 1 FlgK